MAGYAHVPYLATVTARACHCRQPPKELGRRRTLDAAITLIDGYWQVYLGFFGDQFIWLTFEVVDTRDGQVMWRNGRPITLRRGNAF